MAYGRWALPASALTSRLGAREARDLVVECFYQAQCETFARAKEKLTGVPQEPREMRASVEGAVRIAFRESGGDFERPTRESLAKAVEVLGRKASSWGTPVDIIRHHSEQIGRLLRQVVD